MKKLLFGISFVLFAMLMSCGEPGNFTVTFDSQNGSDVDSVTVTESRAGEGALVDEPVNEPSKDYATFLGWYKEAAGTTPWNFDTDLVRANRTLYAKWDDWATVATPVVTANETLDFLDDEIIVSTTTSGATILWSDNDTTFNEENIVSGGKFNLWNNGFIADSVTVYFKAVKDGMISSQVEVRTFTKEKATFFISPNGGTLLEGIGRITLSTTTVGATIYYTTDNSDPTTSSSLFSLPFTLDELGETTVKAIAIKDGMENSDVATATFTAIEETTAMVFVEGSTFSMGTASGHTDEEPVHSVTVSDFYMGQYEVTQKEYREVMDYDPCAYTSYGKGDNNPVHLINWYRAIAYCNKLSLKMGLEPVYTVSGVNFATLTHRQIPTSDDSTWNSAICDWTKNGYRLPTEAEWEYAAKGGIHKENFTYSGSNDIGLVAWYEDNSGDKTHTVGTQASNKLGLYDMSGNVWEWCWDWYHSSYYENSPDTNPKGPASGSNRVTRGGSFFLIAYNSRVAEREHSNPSSGHKSDGFRVVRSAF